MLRRFILHTNETTLTPTATHWGNYLVESDGVTIKAIHPYEVDKSPTPIGQSLGDVLDENCRVAQPMIRAGYLAQGIDSDRSGRGREPFVAVEWERAWDLAAEALARVKREFGNEAIYAGSYGWGSAGTLHHPKSQLYRFMNLFEGFTTSVNSYSCAAGEVIIPHVMGNMWTIWAETPSWQEIAEHTELVVLFGGAALKNSQIGSGGVGPHTAEQDMIAAKNAGVEFVSISPIRDDLATTVGSEWISLIPHTDTAVLLALAHTLVVEDLYDKAFIQKYCVGFEKFLPYLLGEQDGQAKDADWAGQLSQIPAETIRNLARRMAQKRTMLAISWSIQRAEYGEQPFWMATVLAAMLGEIGLPGRGIAYGYNAIHGVGSHGRPPVSWPGLSTGVNPVKRFIPVARIADLLLKPNQPFDYNGQKLTYPDIKLVYWVGGNPFHHHQDLNRLLAAWRKPETIIVHEPWWNANARHADIVFTRYDTYLTPSRQVVPPFQQARNDYDIFTGLAERLGFKEIFTENRDDMAWLRTFYETAIRRAEQNEVVLPDFESFWLGEQISIQDQIKPKPTFLNRFRQDPEGAPLRTPSGKIEIFSETIAGFGYDDCLGHPAWFPPSEWLGSAKAKMYPLHLLSNQPKTRLHSQLDHAVTSRNGKIKGREPARLHPQEAAARGIKEGDLIRIYNDRGACLAAVTLAEEVRPGIIQLPTGAWYNPAEPGQIGTLEIHGNPNVLTRDVGTSKLGQGPSANSTLVEVERYDGPELSITVFQTPPIISETA